MRNFAISCFLQCLLFRLFHKIFEVSVYWNNFPVFLLLNESIIHRSFFFLTLVLSVINETFLFFLELKEGERKKPYLGDRWLSLPWWLSVEFSEYVKGNCMVMCTGMPNYSVLSPEVLEKKEKKMGLRWFMTIGPLPKRCYALYSFLFIFF